MFYHITEHNTILKSVFLKLSACLYFLVQGHTGKCPNVVYIVSPTPYSRTFLPVIVKSLFVALVTHIYLTLTSILQSE